VLEVGDRATFAGHVGPPLASSVAAGHGVAEPGP
jgi:hypothetical protein